MPRAKSGLNPPSAILHALSAVPDPRDAARLEACTPYLHVDEHQHRCVQRVRIPFCMHGMHLSQASDNFLRRNLFACSLRAFQYVRV